MSAFTFDTSGVVIGAFPTPTGTAAQRFLAWPDLTPFEQGYVKALFESLPVDLMCQWLDTVDQFRKPAFSDLSPEALEMVRRDCAQAQKDFSHPELGHTGAWFWERRQAGQWPHWSPLTISLGDGGKVYLTPAVRP